MAAPSSNLFSVSANASKKAEIAQRTGAELWGLFSQKLAPMIAMATNGLGDAVDKQILSKIFGYLESTYGPVLAKNGNTVDGAITAEYVVKRVQGMQRPATGSYRSSKGGVYALVAFATLGTEAVDLDPFNLPAQLFDGNGLGQIVWGDTSEEVRQFLAMAVHVGELDPGSKPDQRLVRSLLKDKDLSVDDMADDFPTTYSRWLQTDEDQRPKVKGKPGQTNTNNNPNQTSNQQQRPVGGQNLDDIPDMGVHSNRILLRDYMIAKFSLKELKFLCDTLGWNYENIEGATKDLKALGMVLYADYRGLLPKLAVEVGKMTNVSVATIFS